MVNFCQSILIEYNQPKMNSIQQLIKQQPEDWSLKQEFYKQADIYEREIEKIYMDSWLFIGHHS